MEKMETGESRKMTQTLNSPFELLALQSDGLYNGEVNEISSKLDFPFYSNKLCRGISHTNIFSRGADVFSGNKKTTGFFKFLFLKCCSKGLMIRDPC